MERVGTLGLALALLVMAGAGAGAAADQGQDQSQDKAEVGTYIGSHGAEDHLIDVFWFSDDVVITVPRDGSCCAKTYSLGSWSESMRAEDGALSLSRGKPAPQSSADLALSEWKRRQQLLKHRARRLERVKEEREVEVWLK